MRYRIERMSACKAQPAPDRPVSKILVKTCHGTPTPPFPDYDDAPWEFEKQFRPCCEEKIILSPRKVLNQYKATFPAKTANELRFRSIPIKLAENQDFVSVRGTNSSGYPCEWPDPE
jgi:hypothetical protein